MSITYKVVKQVFGFDKEKTPKYVVRAVTGEMLTFDKVRHQVAQISGIHRATVNSVVEGLLDVLVNNLDMGHSVQLGEFGVLRPGMQAKAQATEEDVKASTIYRRKIIFVPGKMLKELLRNVSVNRMGVQETDYTDDSGNDPADDSSEAVDPRL